MINVKKPKFIDRTINDRNDTLTSFIILNNKDRLSAAS